MRDIIFRWWNDESKELFDAIVDIQPTVEPQETKHCAKYCENCGEKWNREARKWRETPCCG